MKRLISSCVLALSGTAFLSASVMAAEPASCQNVRMGVVNWTDVIATSAMAQTLLDRYEEIWRARIDRLDALLAEED